MRGKQQLEGAESQEGGDVDVDNGVLLEIPVI